MKKLFLLTLFFLQHYLSSGQAYRNEFEAFEDSARNFLYRGKTAQLRALSDSMLKFAIAHHDKILEAKADVWIGTCFSETGEYTSSLSKEFEGLALFKKYKYYDGICFTYKEIGATYKYVGNYEYAEKYLLLAEDYIKKAENSGVRSMSSNLAGRVYTNLCEVYFLKESIDNPNTVDKKKAFDYGLLAEKKDYEVTNDPYGSARTKYVRARINFEDNDNTLLQRCLRYSDSAGVSITYIDASAEYAKFLYNSGRLDEAKEYALKCFMKADSTQKQQGYVKAAGILSKIYYTSDRDSSLYYLRLKDAAGEKVYNAHQLELQQDITFNQDLQMAEENRSIARFHDEIIISIGLIALISVFLILSRFVRINKRVIRFLGVLYILLLFEFVNLILHYFIQKFTGDSLIFTFLILGLLAVPLTYIHHYIDKRNSRLILINEMRKEDSKHLHQIIQRYQRRKKERELKKQQEEKS